MCQLQNLKLKKLKNVETLTELPFYDELNIVETEKALKNYSRTYSIEIIKYKDGNMNDPLVPLEASKPVIKDLIRDLLIEMRGFKDQITVKDLLSKQKQNEDKEYSTVYFNSTAKTVINLNRYGFNKSFQQVLYRINTWINEGSAWATEYIAGEYINISVYSPLSESIYIELYIEIQLMYSVMKIV